jgi:hypothetical protein
MTQDHFYTVDYIDGTIAVLADDNGHTASVPLDRLPRGISPGTVVRVTFEMEHVPNWSRATVDLIETNKRRREENSETD